jgi:hypothetical protein
MLRLRGEIRVDGGTWRLLRWVVRILRHHYLSTVLLLKWRLAESRHGEE